MSLMNYRCLCLTVLFLTHRVTAEVNLSPYASWNQNGTTVAGRADGSGGSALTELQRPSGISIRSSSSDILYVSDSLNNRVVVVPLGSPANVSIIGSGLGSNSSQMNQPCDVFVTNTSLYVLDVGNHRVQKFALDGSNPSTIPGLSAINFSSYIYVDKSDNIYVSNTFNNTVLLFPWNSTNFAIVAGTGVSGNNNDQLNEPNGVFVDRVGTIYVADYINHRVMKWVAGASAGIRVAGNGIPGTSPSELKFPVQVIVDTNEYLYILENGNVRVTRWSPNATSGVCIVACSGTFGLASTQLVDPLYLAFDSYGSLYVSEYTGQRVQKFSILNSASPSYNLPKLSSCATWNPTPITFANVSTTGSDHVNVFVSSNNTIYVSMGLYAYVLVWLEGSSIVTQNISAGLNSTFGIFSTLNGDIYMDNGGIGRQLNKLLWNTTRSVGVATITARCFFLFIDIYGTLYCSFDYRHQVVRIVLNNGTYSQTTIAGNGTAGSQANLLNYPNGIFLDKELNLYVADCYNNRIQKFPVGQLTASTVVGNGLAGVAALSLPTAILLDANEYLYICDSNNNRILRSGPFGVQCIAGCASSAANQMTFPDSMSFDSSGNLFVADSGNNRIQKFLLASNSCAPSYNQPKFSVCAAWNPDAITVANGSAVGSLPVDVFVSSNDTVYVVSESSSSILIWSGSNSTLTGIISDNLTSPDAVFTTSNGDIYISNDVGAGRVERRSSNGTNSIVVMDINQRCVSLFIDINDTLYCSIDIAHQVVQMLLDTKSSDVFIAAGNGTPGSEANTLRYPSGIFVDQTFRLYVADNGNNRIQRFQPNQPYGTTVVGAGVSGTVSLNSPYAVILDADENIFIADANNRIVRSGPLGSQCLLGCTGVRGSAPNQLYNPYSLSFDSNGSLFVVDQGNYRIQKFLLATNTCVPSYNQPQFCPFATWNSSGTTIANQSTVGNLSMYLFVDVQNTLYAVERSLHRVQVWPEGQTSPTRSISAGLSTPSAIFVALNGDVYADNGAVINRVDKWTSDANSSAVVMYVNDSCFGLFIDTNDNLYCSLANLHQVLKKSISDLSNTSVISAGTGIPGNTSDELNGPHGIFVDLNLNLYVADCWNHRVQRFPSNQLNGTTIPMNGTSTLISPTAVVLDRDNYLFISDWSGSRILGSGPTGFRCIVGCTNTSGSAANQLFHPYGIAFDSYGNLFVFDTNNNRLQKFFLATNSCEEATAFPNLITSTVSGEASTNGIQKSSYFLPPTCSSSNRIGVNCNISALPCDLLQPCLNNGSCLNDNTTLLAYICSCLSNFNGTRCQFDQPSCQADTCWNNGTCSQTVNATVVCQCARGWRDDRCQTRINYCENDTCLNGGICRSLLLNYSCLCLDGSYSGRLCEVAARRVMTLVIISKSVAYIAIIMIISVALFVVTLDLLKYFFGIDPVERERQSIRSKNQRKKKRPVQIVRFTYVHASPPQLPENSTATVQETSV